MRNDFLTHTAMSSNCSSRSGSPARTNIRISAHCNHPGGSFPSSTMSENRSHPPSDFVLLTVGPVLQDERPESASTHLRWGGHSRQPFRDELRMLEANTPGRSADDHLKS